MNGGRTSARWDPVIARVVLVGIFIPLGAILGAIVAVFPDPTNPLTVLWIGSAAGVVGASAAFAGLLTGTISDVLLKRTPIPLAVQVTFVAVISGLGSASTIWAAVVAVKVDSPAPFVFGTFLVSSLLSAVACTILRWKIAPRQTSQGD